MPWPNPPNPPPKPPNPPNPPPGPLHPVEVAGVTLRREAVTAPMSLVVPKAVAHSPTFKDALVPALVVVYLVAELTVMSTVLVARLVLVRLAAADVVVREKEEKEKTMPWSVMVDPETAVTLPEAVAKLAGTVTLGRLPEVRVGNEPDPRGKLPKLPAPVPVGRVPAPNRPVQLPEVVGSIVMEVALTPPVDVFVPVAVMQDPALTSLRDSSTVAVILVLEVTLTVVWPLSVFCTSRMLPEILAILPSAAGVKAEVAAPPVVPGLPVAPVFFVAVAAAVVVVVALADLAGVPPPPPHAAATRAKAATDAAHRLKRSGRRC